MLSYYCRVGVAALLVGIWHVKAGASATMTETSARASAMLQELPYAPVLLERVPRLRSPCWYRDELWALAGWGIHDGRHGDHEPLARFDGKRWRFYASPATHPEVLVCDGRTMLVVGETAGEAVAYYREAGQWQVLPMPPGMEGDGERQRRFAGGAAIVAYTPRAIWEWKDRAWQSVPWHPPDANTALARVIPEQAGRWFVVTTTPLGYDWDLAYAHLLPLAPDRKKAGRLAEKMADDLNRVWALAKANKLTQARAKLNVLLARYPHDGQLLFCDARQLWREQSSPQAGMAAAEHHLIHAQGRHGRARLYNLYGAALDELGQHQAMLPWFERAANEYHDPMYFANLAETYEKLHQTELAIRWAHRALAAGSDSKLCIRILREHGVTRPTAAKDPGDYLWTTTIYSFDRSAVDTGAAALTSLETRTLRLGYREGDGPFDESPTSGQKVLPRYLQPTGLGVWHDDVGDATDLRVGPIYSADHVYRWGDKRGQKVKPKTFPHAQGTVFVHQQNFELRRPSATPVTIAYLPFVLHRDQDNRLEPPNLENAHVADSQVYFPYYDTATNFTHIMRFTFDAASHSEQLGSMPGYVSPFFLNGQPVWLSSQLSRKEQTDRSKLRRAQLSFYSLDGRQRIAQAPQLVKGETWYSVTGTQRNFLQSSRGVYRFQNDTWALFTYHQLNIPVVNFPLPSGKPGPDMLAGHPLVFAGHTLWIRDGEDKFRSIDLDHPAAGSRSYTPRVAPSLTEIKTRWTAGTVYDGKLYLASDEHLTVVDPPVDWGDLRYIADDIVHTGDVGLIRLQ